MYIVAQFAGAVLATLVVTALIGKHGTAGLTLPGPGISTGIAMAWEAVLTAGLVSVDHGYRVGRAADRRDVRHRGRQLHRPGRADRRAGQRRVDESRLARSARRSCSVTGRPGGRTWSGPLLGAVAAVAFAHILRGSGGGEFGRRAAQGTLGTAWLPGRRERGRQAAGLTGRPARGTGQRSHR